MTRFPLKAVILSAACLTACLSLVPAISVLASGSVYGSGDYGECEYGYEGSDCTISIVNNGGSSTGNDYILDLPILPTISGSCTIQSDQVAVTTYDPDGYTLTLGSANTTTDLEQGSNSVPATTGTLASPIALSDTWGYRVDGTGGFGAGPTSAEINAALNNSIKFAQPQSSSNTADTIASTSTFSSGAVNTTTWFGICLDTNLAVPNGTYTASVLYTAVAN